MTAPGARNIQGVGMAVPAEIYNHSARSGVARQSQYIQHRYRLPRPLRAFVTGNLLQVGNKFVPAAALASADAIQARFIEPRRIDDGKFFTLTLVENQLGHRRAYTFRCGCERK